MKTLNLLLVLVSSLVFSQQEIFERLSALDNNGKIWYNIDGYSVTSQKFNSPFTEKGLKKIFRKHQISKNDTKTSDKHIKFKNYFISKKQRIIGNIFQTNHYYFVENTDQETTVIWFIKNGTTDRTMEEELVNLIIENKIPSENFVPMKMQSIDFAGRKIELGNSCYWTFLNTVQCPYLGEMNWSVHQTLESAKEAIENQLNVTQARNGIKIVSEEMVDIEFEGISTKAKKVILKPQGVKSALAGMSGGKTLTVYYIAEKVRDKNVSCVMSFWNNDQINPKTQLPPLLEKLMKLK